MSLETNLELNNQLLTQHNALLERLISALTAGAPVTTNQATTTVHVHEYRETAAVNTVPENAELTLDDMEFSDVIAIAGFYPSPSAMHSQEMFQRAIEYRSAESESRVVQIDALDSALQGVKRAKSLHKSALLDLARHILRFWDDLPTIAARRDFAERLLDEPAGGRDDVKPKATGAGEERKGPFYCRNANSSAASEVHSMRKLKTLLDTGHIEINKVEYLQLQEKFQKQAAEKSGSEGSDSGTSDKPDFAAMRKQAEGLILQLAKGGYRAEAVAILENQGAKKLGEVADENLADVIAQAEKALEV
ncbi:hypothetical protein HmCmsJML134_00137 [Escherichia coli]|uniref:hypothetical protein n=1 Tax=Escherichia coli TaxID=562 RepID=UPI0010E3B004|nr:hypothetical protein [Escherichia coli]EHS7020122.1 hypothetical protein [Escherichia coli]GDB17660.1 hypothetical protein HmCmsJML134_00137 [Escherichia coli]